MSQRGSHPLDMAAPVIHTDELLLHYVQLLQRVWVLGICYVTYVVKDFTGINQFSSVLCNCSSRFLQAAAAAADARMGTAVGVQSRVYHR